MGKRNWPRDKQRAYREARRKQAALVTDRLLGKKKYIPPAHDDFMDALSYKWATNLYVAQPRNNVIITGFNGV